MKRNTSQRSQRSEKQASQSKEKEEKKPISRKNTGGELSKQSSKQQSKSKNKVQSKEEEKKAVPQQQAPDLRPVLHAKGKVLAIRNRQNNRMFDVMRVSKDFKQGDQALQVVKFVEVQQDLNRNTRSLDFMRDAQLHPNPVNVDDSEIVFEFEVKEKKGRKQIEVNLNNDIKVKKAEIKKANKALKLKNRNDLKAEKQRVKAEKEQQKAQGKGKKQSKSKSKAKSISKQKSSKQEEVKMTKQQSKIQESQERSERARKRLKQKDDDDDDEEEKQINTGNNEGEEGQGLRKRDKKAKSKAKQKVVKAKKVVEEMKVREDVQIPDIIESKESLSTSVFTSCCQTCSNRNCMRAAYINSPELFEKCIQSKAYVTSLIEHQSPEIRISCLEFAIANNRHEIIELLFAQEKPENEGRLKKKAAQIEKFDTGEVSKLAFGVKVRKVNIMRGNRQGNNAFLEDSQHIWLTPLEYLLRSDYCMGKIFAKNTITVETIELLHKLLKDEKEGNPDKTFDEFLERALPSILQHGCYKALVGIFKVKGNNLDPMNSLYSNVFLQLLTVDQKANFTITKQDIARANKNTKYKPSHIAALNPSGEGLKFIQAQGEEINVVHNKFSTAHFAAVCNSTKNLDILIEADLELHAEDEHKKTPLIWALEASQPAAVIKLIFDNLDQKAHKDFKEDHKKMAIHYVAQYGCSENDTTEVMDMMMENKAKMSQVGGWDKYTPLEYAATYGQYEVVEYFLQKVPKLNLNKGDKYNRTPLIMACRNGHAKIAALLIKYNASIEQADSSGNTPLHHAAAYGWLECVALLIRYGADPSPENAWKTTPIIIALQKNHLAIVKELLSVKNDLNANIKDDEGRTLLTLSMANINRETIEFVNMLLNEKQADPNSQDAKGRTPLYHLVYNMTQKKRGLFEDHDNLENKIVKILLSAGANVNIKAKDGKSPFTLAFEYGLTDLMKIFGQGVDLNQDPSLFFAISGTNVLKVKSHELLIECMNQRRLEDETINFINDQGQTPFLYYIIQFLNMQVRVSQVVQSLINNKNKVITNEMIVEETEKNNNLNNIVSNEAQQILKREITEPFIEFLKTLIQNGANPNAYILKLKQYREDIQQLSLTQEKSQMSQLSSSAVAAFQQRRPPEKDQYVSEELGLSNAIHLLITNQNSEIFDYLMSIQGIALNQVNFKKMTPFFMLVKNYDIKLNPYYKHCFDALLQSGQVDINAPDQFGSSAFWYFYTQKRYDDAMFLVDRGANINHMDNYGEFALKRELYAGDYNLMKRLLEKGANPNQKDEFGRTVLHLACNFANRRDMKEIIKLLVKHNADIADQDFKQRNPLYYLFIRKNRRYERDLFEPYENGLALVLNENTKQGLDINQQDVNGKTLIHYAAQRGSLRSLEYFIQLYSVENIQFDLTDKWLNTALSIAINCRHIQFVEKLIGLGVMNLKGFIYEEPLPKQGAGGGVNQFNQNLFGGAQQQQDNQEQSDFEFMEVVQQQDNNLLQDKQQAKHNKEEALNLFRYLIKNNLQDLEKLFIKNNYDKIQMVIDYICEGQIGKLFQVIETHFKQESGAKGSILIQKNEKNQNLIHVLARNSHRIKEIGEIAKFYKQLIGEGVNSKESDYKGRTALHFAVKSGNLHFIKFLIEVEKFDVNAVDQKGGNIITALLKGDRILKANSKILEYLIQSGCNPNCQYEESLYQESSIVEKANNKQEEEEEEEKVNTNVMNGNEKKKKSNNQIYKTTCLIHAIRHESKERDNIKEILKILLKYGETSALDSTGRDAFMYIAMRNHYNTFNFILDQLKEDKSKVEKIQKNTVDLINGRSFIHYIVNPLPYGSFENKDLLKKALEFGFEANLVDKQGKTPYQYACEQRSGVLRKVFEKFGIGNAEKEQKVKNNKEEEDEEMKLEDLIPKQAQNQDNAIVQQQPAIDFEKDAHEYLYSIQMQIDPLKSVPCDPSGKFNDDCEVFYDEDLKQHFDVYLTRVEIGKFQPGGDYLFYRMQLVWDKARDLYILLTRWGRIGEEGAFQKTPFSKQEEAVNEFRKIFEQKTNNKWCHRDKFAKKFRKFQLMRTNYVTIDQKNYLTQFTNLEEGPLISKTSKEVIEVMREICDVNTYLKALQNSGVDSKAMPFSNLHRQNLYDALDVLQKLEKTLDKLEQMNPRPYSEDERNKLLGLREKMWYLSSRFYEYIPHEEFRNKMVPPISTSQLLATKSQMLQNLIDIELASKILLGAHGKREEVHPLEYCLQATGTQMINLPTYDPEYKLIEEYVNNTKVEHRNNKIQRIIKLVKENQKFREELDHKVLLFHGSKVSNFLSMLSQGMKVQPMQVKRQGNLLGKGIYFTDVFSKAFTYTNDQNAPASSSRFVLVCEVALGEQKVLSRIQNNYVLEQGFDSVLGQGRQGPELKKHITLPDGAKIPYGKCQNYNANRQAAMITDFQYNEYVVPSADQVLFRYLIQMK